jgi:hypothetical protein
MREVVWPSYLEHQTDTGFPRNTSDFRRAPLLIMPDVAGDRAAYCLELSTTSDDTARGANGVGGRCRSNGDPASGHNAPVSLSCCYACR